MPINKTRTFSANVGDKSIGNAGPDAIEHDIDNMMTNQPWNDEVIKIGNETPFVPTKDYEPATKKYADSRASFISHAADDDIYGLATQNLYGHVKVIDDLTKEVYADGEALSAHQGKVIKDNIEAVGNISRGTVRYTDTILPGPTTVVKTIPIGSNKKQGKLIIGGSDTSVDSMTIVEFNEFKYNTIAIRGGSNYRSRSFYEEVYGEDVHYGYTLISGVVHLIGNNILRLDEVYINGENIVIVFYNRSTTTSYTLDCRIDWEVW